MPGIASIKWTSANMEQALCALIAYGAVKLDDEIAQKVADHLGNGCTTTAIQNLVRTRKASFKHGVLPATDGDDSPTSKPAPKRKRKTAAETDDKTPKKPRKSTKKTAKKEDTDEKDDEVNKAKEAEEGKKTDRFTTPPPRNEFSLTTPPAIDS